MSELHKNPEYPEELPYRRVLDHGFVALVDVMGSDASIVQAARVSYGKGTRTVRSDKALISYLMRHRHSTPSEMVEFKFLMRLPVFIARQVIRHRTACLAEGTEVYFDLPGGIKRRGNKLYRLRVEDIWEKFQPTRNQIPSQQKNPYFKRDRVRRMRLRQMNEDTGRIRHTGVVDVFKNGKKPVFRMVLADGKTIEATAEHRFHFADGWHTLEAATGLKERSGRAVWSQGDYHVYVNGLEVCEPKPYQDRDWLNEQYNVRNRRIAVIADECGVSHHTIRKWLREFGIQRPTGGRSQDFAEQLGGASVTKAQYKRKPREAWDALVAAKLVRIERFEYVGIKETYDLEVEGPYHNFIANGIVTHNSVNEYSARYSEVPDRFWVPSLGAIAEQDTVNRQGRADQLRDLVEALPDRAGDNVACAYRPDEPAVLVAPDGTGISRAALLDAAHRQAFTPAWTGTDADLLPTENYGFWTEQLLERFPERKERLEQVRRAFHEQNEKSYALYRRLLEQGVAREIARSVLPLSMYTEWYWKMDLHNLMHFLSLRMDAHAQYEVRCFAEAVATFVKDAVPFSWEAFQEDRLRGTFLSGAEKEALRPTDPVAQRAALEALYEKGYRRRRLKEVCRKLAIDERLVDEMWPPQPKQS